MTLSSAGMATTTSKAVLGSDGVSSGSGADALFGGFGNDVLYGGGGTAYASAIYEVDFDIGDTSRAATATISHTAVTATISCKEMRAPTSCLAARVTTHFPVAPEAIWCEGMGRQVTRKSAPASLRAISQAPTSWCHGPGHVVAEEHGSDFLDGNEGDDVLIGDGGATRCSAARQ